MNKEFRLDPNLTSVINGFTMWKYVKAITTPFDKTKAFKKGIIDFNGNYLKNPNRLTRDEKKSLTPFDVMIFNIKKLFNKIIDPSIKVRLKYIPTAIPLLAEEAEKYGADPEFIAEQLLELVYERGILIEEIENMFLAESGQLPPREAVDVHYNHAADIHSLFGRKGIHSFVETMTNVRQAQIGTGAEGRMSVFVTHDGTKRGIAYKGLQAPVATTHEEVDRFYPDIPPAADSAPGTPHRDRSHVRQMMKDTLDHMNGGGFDWLQPGSTIQADLLWTQQHGPPTVQDGMVSFTPNLITNKAPVSSPMGQAIQRAKIGIAPHTRFIHGDPNNPDSWRSENFSTQQTHPDVWVMGTASPQLSPEHHELLNSHLTGIKDFSDTITDDEYSTITKHGKSLSGFFTQIRIGKRQRTFEDFAKHLKDVHELGLLKLKSESGRNKKSNAFRTQMESLAANRGAIEKALELNKRIFDYGEQLRTGLDGSHELKRSIGDKETSPEKYVFHVPGIGWHKVADTRFTSENLSNNLRFRRVSTTNQSSKPKIAVVQYGRGGLHLGHTALAEAAIKKARELGGVAHIVTSQSGPNHKDKKVALENPLTSEERLHLLRTSLGFTKDTVPHDVQMYAHKNVLSLLENLHSQGYTDIHFVAGKDNDGTTPEERWGDSLRSQNKPDGMYNFSGGITIHDREDIVPGFNVRGSEIRRNILDAESPEGAVRAVRPHVHGNITDEQLQETTRLIRNRTNEINNRQPPPRKPRKPKTPISESIFRNITAFLREEGEAVQSSPIINSVGSGGIAGIGQDAADGNVVVRKRTPILRRKKRK